MGNWGLFQAILIEITFTPFITIVESHLVWALMKLKKVPPKNLFPIFINLYDIHPPPSNIHHPPTPRAFAAILTLGSFILGWDVPMKDTQLDNGNDSTSHAAMKRRSHEAMTSSPNWVHEIGWNTGENQKNALRERMPWKLGRGFLSFKQKSKVARRKYLAMFEIFHLE